MIGGGRGGGWLQAGGGRVRFRPNGPLRPARIAGGWGGDGDSVNKRRDSSGRAGRGGLEKLDGCSGAKAARAFLNGARAQLQMGTDFNLFGERPNPDINPGRHSTSARVRRGRGGRVP